MLYEQVPVTSWSPGSSGVTKSEKTKWLLILVGVVVSVAIPIIGLSVVTSKSTPQTVAEWKEFSSSKMLAIAKTLGDVSSAADERDLSKLHSDCKTLISQSVKTHGEVLPTPNRELTEEVDVYLTSLAEAGFACIDYDGTSYTNVSAVTFNTKLRQANNHMRVAKRILSENI